MFAGRSGRRSSAISVTTPSSSRTAGCSSGSRPVREQLLGNACGADRRLPHLLHVGALRLAYRLLGKLGEAEDDGHHVVDFMGDTAGEPADRLLHALRAVEPLLGAPNVADVLNAGHPVGRAALFRRDARLG